MQKIKKFTLAAVSVSAAFLLAACGSQQSSSSSSKDKQVLKLSATAPLDTIDISKSTGYGQTGNVFESFYRLGKNGQPAAGLAKSGTVSKDGKTWTFKLRSNAKWSNGEKITAQDFVYSWRRTINPKTASPYAYLFSGIKNADEIIAGKKSPSSLGIKALNQETVQVKLNRPIAYFKVLMAYPLFGPQNEAFIKKTGKKYATSSKYMLYSGPFKITGWKGTNDTWSFVKNNQYWDKQAVKLSKISYQVVKTTNTGYQLYQQGKLDLTPLSSEQVKQLKKNKDFKTYPYSYVAFLAYNFQAKDATVKKALNNKNIRLALSLSLDRKILTSKVFGDGSSVPTGFVASGLAYDPANKEDFAKEQKVANTVDYNEKLAEKYWKIGLKELGLKKLNLTLLASNEGTNADALTQYLQSQWTKVLSGINVKVNSIPSKNAYTKASSGDFDIYVSGWGGDFSDPMTFMQILQKGTSYNYGKWNNAEYNRLIKKALTTDANDVNKRWQDLVKAAQVANADQAVSPIYQQTTAYLQNSKVKGIIHNNAGTQWSYKYAYIK
ncbi:peptide ABC transporter substrate-binding protein [Lactobacillus delbrueckii subsp. delbrueckii DSM 20074 = JCM 1012]|uniref:peptide ABC transporter substrate-binding protein n=1 Tax=Lactobacillus delbrueckii TaxID=1584 RepID=UPI00069961AD|nr:peptide ABC transporter substrate-binding protein [Lactobacillus delbrueckii]APP09548.1 peptide ABC transporter substrate-binding protein [Lactobacillus delbrueckii subsp. delbrueckii DSM 20074 = JCM 1012]KNZ38294.1 peptide ABC transporter substrate-binding protein [Lactobacillus delbrueckii subsp. delbrueckii]KRK19765.1 peptide ABC transporter substrate-binding protein [Lactobacillus delbrueckii subsp. delbrueckii DSM 20074 = JCM 1012]MCT3521985.1 peptide ABC transporter substrate-binding p